MCKWYCTSEGPSTNLDCLHCRARYCGACLHGEAGKMESLVKCAKCGKKPRVKAAEQRGQWSAQVTPPTAPPAYTAKVASKNASTIAAAGLNDVSASAVFAASMRSDAAVITSPKRASIFDKLTDSSLYTGAHKHRFDESGKGKGMSGRDSIVKGDGHVPVGHIVDPTSNNLANLLRADVKQSPVQSPKTKPLATKTPKSAAKPSIFDKLTDPGQYTGAHKMRFDAAGRGRGMSGRDASSGIEYGGAVKSLSSITRTNLN